MGEDLCIGFCYPGGKTKGEWRYDDLYSFQTGVGLAASVDLSQSTLAGGTVEIFPLEANIDAFGKNDSDHHHKSLRLAIARRFTFREKDSTTRSFPGSTLMRAGINTVYWGVDLHAGITDRGDPFVGVELNALDKGRILIPGIIVGIEKMFGDEGATFFYVGSRLAFPWLTAPGKKHCLTPAYYSDRCKER